MFASTLTSFIEDDAFACFIEILLLAIHDITSCCARETLMEMIPSLLLWVVTQQSPKFSLGVELLC